ncbi:MAG: molybdenum cofactor guanylyltransferase [Opitutus sp.]|nr:molybdenum cofactor guanylyltransferase [Opitutus sp.]MCS6246531.1 molybdenum cofactor guanylyltransferase [Opitutus sp.]MCS6275077.1 molybdenum cofactor guanylyltransferase [Opitutus sp.]MCS6298805.1 molybdenum cofactor guanylyltransferase [Opitutus sp.]
MPRSPTAIPFSAAILAGGRSTRMGRDKAFLPAPNTGIPLIAHQAALLRSLGTDDLLISGKAGVDYGIPGARVVTDAVADRGPLGGLAAVIAAARHTQVLVIAVDLPHLTDAYLKKIIAAAHGSIGVVPQGPDGFEPLVAVYPKGFHPLIEAALAAARLSLQPLIQAAVTDSILLPLPIAERERLLFTNWNTPIDLNR